jgi:Tol biopolymer transport system component
MRRTLLITALALTIAGGATATAGATFPGRNGPIAYRQFDAATGRFSLMRALPDGTQVTELTALPGFYADWRADGRRLAFDFFDADGNEQIATIASDGGDLRTLTSGSGIHEVPSWSPDGRRIVFDYAPQADPNTPGFQTRLWTMRADGSHPRPLPVWPAGFDVEPRYSPDGRWIAFGRLLISSDGQQQQAVFIVGANGGRVRQLTPWELNAEHPTWSPDSRWITFNSLPAIVSPAGAIEAIRPDGRARHTIFAASDSLGAHKPQFSPDGSRVLFMCAITDPAGHYNEDICAINADGTNLVNLTNTPDAFENWPSWGPAPGNSHQE